MRIDQIPKIVNAIESKYNIDEWEIEGIKLWPFIRIEIYMLLSFRSLQSSSINTRSLSYIKKIVFAKIRRLFRTEIGSVIKRNRKTDVVFLSSGISYVKMNDFFYEKNIDPIFDLYRKERISSIRLDLDYLYPKPTYSPTAFIQPEIDNITIRSIITSKFFPPKFNNENWSDYETFLNDPEVISYLPKIHSKDQLRAKIYRVINIKNFFLKKLKNRGIKVAFLECYYSDVSMAFTLACKELCIKTVDIQHGVQGDLHLAYGSWRKVPLGGFDSLPNYFLVWTQDEEESINSWRKGISNHKPLVLGNLYSYIWKQSEDPMVKEFDVKVNNIKRDHRARTILVTLSPFTDDLMSSSWEVMKQFQNQYNWLVRLHPSMNADMQSIQNKMRVMGITAVEMEQTSSLPLYSILKNVDLHITCQSSCVLEAAEFDVQSIITSEYGGILFQNLVKQNKATVALTKEELSCQIERLLLNGKESCNVKDNSINNKKLLLSLICDL